MKYTYGDMAQGTYKDAYKDAHKEDESAWELTRSLVSIDSSDPGAFEGEIGDWIFSWLEQVIENEAGILGKEILLERREVLPGRFNVRARIPAAGETAVGAAGEMTGEAAAGMAGESAGKPAGTEGQPGLVYICHMDTVTLGDGWKEETPALGAAVRDGRIYGRGACDMKAGLACALLAFRSMAALCGTRGELPSRSFSFVGTVDEEDFMRGVEAAISWGWVHPWDWILDTEPTDGQIQVAHKGRTWFEVTVTGITAHASNPWKGADAIAAMAEVIGSVRRSIAACPSHEDLGRSTVTFGQIEGGYRPYVVPDSCRVWIDMRLVPPADTAAAREMVERALRQAEKEIPGVKGSYVITGDRPFVEKDGDSPLLKKLKMVCDEVTGEDTAVGAFNGYTDTAVIAGTLRNHNCMSYGPGSLEMAHKPNEYVPLEDIKRVRDVLFKLAEESLWG